MKFEEAGAMLAAVAAETEAAESGGGHSYFGILIGNLTTDAWVVIIILGIMFAISAAVMVPAFNTRSGLTPKNAGFHNTRSANFPVSIDPT